MTIVDASVSELRCWTYKYNDEVIIIEGELDYDFTDKLLWHSYLLVQSSFTPAFNSYCTITDEEGYAYPGYIDTDGNLFISIRRHAPEAIRQILRFFVLAVTHG